MKKDFLIFFILAIVSASVYSQHIDEKVVPAAVRDVFMKQFPGIKGKWEKEKNNYEVNFKKDNRAMSAVIDAKGAIVETETEMAVRDLPAAVATYIKTRYKGAVIKEAARIVKPGGEMQYEAEVNGKDILFDDNGKFIKEEKD